MSENYVDARKRQEPLRQHYRESPEEALIVDGAQTVEGVTIDAFHGYVKPGSQDYAIKWPFGIHRAVGGDHDLPNPGDILCTALAACLDSTIRIIANRLGISLASLEVTVRATVDVRGTLVVERDVPLGFQSMQCHVNLQPAPGTDPNLLGKLLSASEYSCINLQTLRAGVPIEVSIDTRADGL